MKPLVLYCRWHSATLRLFGRDETAVWGELAYQNYSKPFKFHLKDWVLNLGEGDDAKILKLDEMGVVVKD